MPECVSRVNSAGCSGGLSDSTGAASAWLTNCAAVAQRILDPAATSVDTVLGRCYFTVKIGMGQLGAADSAPPTRRRDNSAQGQLDAGDSARGHFGAASVTVT